MKRHSLTIDGETRTINAWSKQPGAATRSVVLSRLARGMTPQDAVFGIPNADRARLLEINGVTMTTKAWSRQIGAYAVKAIRERIARGYEPIDAVFYNRDFAPKPRRAPAPVSVYSLRPTWGSVLSVSWRAA